MRAGLSAAFSQVVLGAGVTTCVGDLLTDGFSLRSYRSVKTCAHLEQTFPVVAGRVIDDYCMVTVQ